MPSLTQFINDSVLSRPTDPIVLDSPVPLDAIPTPALTLDLDVFEKNLERMQAHLNSSGIHLRAHAKMHKCPEVARRQLKLGAKGICTATVSEAEVMLSAGIEAILITSPVSTRDKIGRISDMATRSQALMTVLDNPSAADSFEAELAGRSTTLKCLIDLDPGMGRTGISPGDPALNLARHIADHCPHLDLQGIQIYAGHCMHIHNYSERRDRYAALMQKGIDTRSVLEENGFQVTTVSGGGTGSYDMESALGLMTELQAGSYAFMDIQYRDICGAETTQFDDFDPALFVMVTAISQPSSRAITVDAGFKSFASDAMTPQFRTVDGTTFRWGGDEHGIVLLDNPSRHLSLGDRLEMIVPHCDPTVNLHDFYYPYRDGMVSEIWPISARGCSA